MIRPYLWILLPALTGFLLAVLVNIFSPVNPVFYLRASLSVLLFFLGLLGSLVAGFVFRRQQQQQHYQQALSEAQDDLAADRRRFLRRLDHELKNPLTAIRTGLAERRRSDA